MEKKTPWSEPENELLETLKYLLYCHIFFCNNRNYYITFYVQMCFLMES
jgi:coproporphyrinogen III oxidase-like Fe-S oxidoreductase